ncbi:MAG: Uma2 family endonuclease [Polyangiaceae bacterium]|nr:Uma2 family endonuclease [Polyangiaceae bacterium]
MSSSWSVLPLAPDPPSVAMSVAAWLDLDEDDPGELVRGQLTEEEVPDATHELIVAWLVWTLKNWLGSRGLVLGSDLRVLVGDETGRKPDLTVYLDGSRLPPRNGPVTSPPDLLVEVISPSPRDERRDRVEKMAEYAQFGVRYYWLVDPALGSFEMFELVDGRYSKAVGATAGVVTDVPGCQGLRLDVDALWRELARLPES